MKKILAALLFVGLCLALCGDAMAHFHRYVVPVYPAPPVVYAPHHVVPPVRYYAPLPPPPPVPGYVVPLPPPPPVYAPGYYYPRGGVTVHAPFVGVHVGF